ncbi:carboxylesterase family protein [Micrococcus sp. TA1]|uniref:carboxylesterase family protein n=1 Tax=Micrococcus sp. TA1 TaxID=681627 RepID=UPI0016083E4F|nr:carboxylesterase family protein [Micrococcus sp. TA1]MBB5749532.1 para-nitrobenzyl esterase [Micrococcus sp. TA1]
MTSVPQWTCPAGTLRGWVDEDPGRSPVWRATGIRYARANRYEPPRPEPAAVGTVEATGWSPACPQRPVRALEGVSPGRFLGPLEISEHCQYLSVTTPAGAGPDERLPVMVWIHGGGYVIGAGDQPYYDAGALVSEQRVVTVNITYRLGMFGFLGRDGVPANLGLLDIIEALRWVRRNITAFGGDPENVTVWGESAGADAAAHLMIAEGTEGLFSRVIMQSAPIGLMRGRAAMTAALGERASRLPADAPVEDLLRMEADLAWFALRLGLGGAMPFGPEYGAHPLPGADRREAAWIDAARRVDVLVGSNLREAALFAPVVGPVARLHRIPVLGPPVHEGLVRWLTDVIFTRGAEHFIRRHAAARGHGYHYLVHAEAEDNPLSSAHAAELPLLFGNRKVWGTRLLHGFDPAETEAWGRRMRADWAGFARTGRIETGTVDGLMTVRAGDDV